MRTLLALLSLVTPLCLAGFASAELVPYEATLQIDFASGQQVVTTRVVDVAFAGLADLDAGVVSIAAGELSTPFPMATGTGTLRNGALVFSIGGAGAGSSCPLSEIQEICIAGGGFGGAMAISIETPLGQVVDAWGRIATTTWTTPFSSMLAVAGTNWTTGAGSAWFYVPEIDPTPFLISGAGSFAGLPSTDPAPGEQGFRTVTPVMITGSAVASTPNSRGLATLTVRFPSQPVPLWIGTALGAALIGAGVLRLRAGGRRVAPPPTRVDSER